MWYRRRRGYYNVHGQLVCAKPFAERGLEGKADASTTRGDCVSVGIDQLQASLRLIHEQEGIRMSFVALAVEYDGERWKHYQRPTRWTIVLLSSFNPPWIVDTDAP